MKYSNNKIKETMMKKNYLLFVLLTVFSLMLISCDTKKDGGTDPTGTDTTKAVTVEGKVVSAQTGAPISGAIIKVSDGNIVKGATTNSAGNFSTKFETENDVDLTVIVFAAGYFQDTTKVFGIVNEVTKVPLFQLQRDESSNAGDFSGRGASIYLFAQSKEFIGVKESGSDESALITFEIRDSSGVVIGDSNAVDVSFRFGATPGGGEYLYPSHIKSNALGKVSVSLNTGTVAGVCQVIAETVVDGKPIRSKPVNISIHGGFPDDAHFSIGTDQLNYPYWNVINGKVEVSVLVGDKYSNPVRVGTSVYFSSDAGVIEGSAQTNKLGTATVTMLSGDPQPNDPTYGPGFFYVHASTITEDEQHIYTKNRVLFSGQGLITLTPRSFTIDNGGSQEFTYTVMDVNGNPLAPGSTYSVSVNTGGDAAATGDIKVTMPDVQSGYTSFSFTVFDTKVDEVNPSDITVTINVNSPNGNGSITASGTTR